jgi:16S rRNA (guanine1516-N2)-methyltransferase
VSKRHRPIQSTTSNIRIGPEESTQDVTRKHANIGIVIADDHAESHEYARRVSEQTNLPIVKDDDHLDFALCVGSDGVSLRDVHVPKDRPVRVEFVTHGVVNIRQLVGGIDQPLARAIGCGNGRPTIIDATAGLGGDAFRFAMWGCDVRAVERSDVVVCLLEDGLRRAMEIPILNDAIQTRLELIHANAVNWLPNQPSDSVDVVYLDPMYPVDPKSSALAKKEMRILRKIIGHDEDARSLFVAATRVARRRVVVKRSPHAPSLGPPPDIVQRGKIARYDIYTMTS